MWICWFNLLENNIIDSTEYDDFSQSIHTVAKTFIEDLEFLQSNQVTKNEFILKYGHLRPGTYDITSPSYKDNFDNYIQINSKNSNEIEKANSKYTVSENFIIKIEKEIEAYNLNFDAKKLLDFIVKATEARELSKFEFTKNLNAVLELILKMGNELNISKEDAAHLNLDYILKMSNCSSTVNIKKDLENLISKNKTKHLISKAIQLPELIFDIKDTEMFFYSQLKPNFISHHSIMGEIVKLENSIKQDINDKVVMIENADPGFDWIFSHDIKGLITKYGGAASHMAIRCAEFDIPAAIGCGDKIFNELLKHDKILLDCSNQIVKGLK